MLTKGALSESLIIVIFRAVENFNIGTHNFIMAIFKGVSNTTLFISYNVPYIFFPPLLLQYIETFKFLFATIPIYINIFTGIIIANPLGSTHFQCYRKTGTETDTKEET